MLREVGFDRTQEPLADPGEHRPAFGLAHFEVAVFVIGHVVLYSPLILSPVNMAMVSNMPIVLQSASDYTRCNADGFSKALD